MSSNARGHLTNAIILAFAVVAAFVFRSSALSIPIQFDWEFCAFLALALLLDRDPTNLKHRARGSTLFLVVCALAIVRGAASAMLVILVGAAVAGVVQRRSFRKVVFNASQHCVALFSALLLFELAGGRVPAAFLNSTLTSPSDVALEIARFFGFVLAYLLLNSLFVSLVVSIDLGGRFMDVWRGNGRGAFSFDVSSVAVSILGAVAFVFFDRLAGLGVLGVGLIAVPMLGSRKSYLLLRQLQASGEELLELMVKAIEARDPYTSGHSLRVQRLSVAIARDLGFSAREMEDVATAALLHDIGKIHEEFAPVLRKEGKLTLDERALVESHAEKGAALVGVISRFRGTVQEAVRHHHERWDGQGYPSGLSGESIPRISRIIFVADTIDAMTTDRPYRSRLSFDAVVSELKRFSGSQFDPEVAACALSSLSVRRLISEGETSRASPEVPAVEPAKAVRS